MIVGITVGNRSYTIFYHTIISKLTVATEVNSHVRPRCYRRVTVCGIVGDQGKKYEISLTEVTDGNESNMTFYVSLAESLQNILLIEKKTFNLYRYQGTQHRHSGIKT